MNRAARADLAVSLLVVLAILGPLLGGGFWLVGDMVFVPEQPWKPAWLGLDGALPRAVPMDALVSLATLVVPGAVVQTVLLAGGLLAGGLGVGRLVARLVPGAAWYARAAAILLFCWNPWTYERLLIGQWAILLGYLLLGWVALAALRLRADPRDWGPAAVALVASAVCSPSSGVMAAGVLAVLALGRDRRAWLRAVPITVVANLTWLVPAISADSVRVSTDGVFEGFAARAESSAGVLASLFSLGGIWKTSILPGERTSVAVVLCACLLSAAALAGLRRVPGRWRWVVLAAGSLLLAALPTVAWGAAALESAASAVPGVALLRDSHRFLAPFGLVLAVGIAVTVTWLRERVRPGREAMWSVVGLAVVAPVLVLPSLAWGAHGELQRSTYPTGWFEVAERIGDDDVTVVLPWAGSYRGYDWNHRRAVLDPAPRFLPGVVLVDDSVRLVDRVVPPEDPRVAAVADALATEEPEVALRALGVRWILVEQGMGEVDVPSGSVVYDGDGLTLVDLAADGEVVSGPTLVRPDVATSRQVLVTIPHIGAILLLFAGATWILRTRE